LGRGGGEALGREPVPGDAADGDVEDDQAEQDGDQDVPDRQGRGADQQALAGEEVGAGGVEGGEHAAAGGVGDVLEHAIVALELALLGGGVDGEAAHQVAGAVLAGEVQGDDVVAFAGGVEVTLVGAGAGLHELYGDGLVVGAEHGAADVHEVHETGVF